MKKIRLFLLGLIFLTSSSLTSYAQEKYAVLVSYCTGTQAWSESSWNDLFLMWKLLQKQGYTQENIFVLYANGEDYIRPYYSSNYQPDSNVTITDYAATASNMALVFNGLSNGNIQANIPKCTEDDFLFVWVYNYRGGNTSNVAQLKLFNNGIVNGNTFSSYINSISANKKVVCMQTPNAYGFSDFLTGNNIIFISGSDIGQTIYLADNNPVRENEIINGYTYYHSESNLHFYNAAFQKTPTNDIMYGDSLLSTADLNSDNNISIMEIVSWSQLYNSTLNTIRMLDLGNISENTSIKYPTLLFPPICNETYQGIIGISANVVVPSSCSLTFNENSKIYFTGCNDLFVDKGGTLIIKNKTRVYGGPTNAIRVFGFIKVGTNVTFSAFDSTTNFGGIILSNDVISEFKNVFFYQTGLGNDGQKLDIKDCIFDGCEKVGSSNGNVSISNTTFKNTGIKIHIAIGNYADKKVTVSNCQFYGYQQNSNIDKNALLIEKYGFYEVKNCTFVSRYLRKPAIEIVESGNAMSIFQPNISNCEISQSDSAGVQLYNSTSLLSNNNIHNNNIGLKLMGNSNIILQGTSSAINPSQTQQIKNNIKYEIYSSLYAFPSYIRYNVISDTSISSSFPLIYFDRPNTAPFINIDVRYNCWGNNFNAQNDLQTTNGTFVWNPIWCPPNDSRSNNAAEELYLSASEQIDNENYSQAYQLYQLLIETYPSSIYAQSAIKDIYRLEGVVGADYLTLKDYYTTNNAIVSDTILFRLANMMANNCNIQLRNYDDAIEWYENRIINPHSFQDSIFAIIDLGFLYLKIEEEGAKARGKLSWIIPKSIQQYEEQRDYLLTLLPNHEIQNFHAQQLNNDSKNVVLFQNQPNPFSKNTIIPYKLENDTKSSIMLLIHDIYGRKIREFYLEKTKGNHQLSVTCADLAAGIYFYTLIIDGAIYETKKMMITR